MKFINGFILIIFENIKIFCCGGFVCCCNKNNFKDNEFCFLAGHLDKEKVITFMNNTTKLIGKIKDISGKEFTKIDNLVNSKSRNKLTNKTEVIAIKNFVAFCEILFLLSRSYHLINFLNNKIETNNTIDTNKKNEYKSKRAEYLDFLDEKISKTLTKKISKKEKTTNVNDLMIEVSKKCSECFSKILFAYVYNIPENRINEYNKSDDEYLDCLVSYIPEGNKLIF